MTLAEIKSRIMFQSNNDDEDIEDYLPHVTDYINDGYDRLVFAWAKAHCGSDDWPWLAEDTDSPLTPEWTHKFLADWATWLVYRNGNPQKQQRGMAFRNAFEEMLSKIYGSGGMNGIDENGNQIIYRNFRNIPN